MQKKLFYIAPLYFDLINLAFINIVFFVFYREAIGNFFLLRAAIGTPIVLLSFYFESIAHRAFEKAHSHPEKIRNMITGGIYSKIRHPIYLGRMLLNLGFLIILPIVPMLFIALLFVIVWYFMALHEEKILMKKFGKRYKKYREKVPMFIPKKSTS